MSSPPGEAERTSPQHWADWLHVQGFSELLEVEGEQEDAYRKLLWSPNDADRHAAWALYTELRTRIATQRLGYRSGDEGTALKSVYDLFEFSRAAIKEHSECHHFAALTVRTVNLRVRPFTARWHQANVDGRLSSADVRYQFRRELSVLQVWLRKFARLLGALAGDLSPIVEIESTELTQGAVGVKALWDPILFGIADDIRGFPGVSANINASEAVDIGERRAFYGLETSSQGTNAVGLAISGGGIRSATFALGVVAQLAHRGILHQVDYLSTVSGGGYLGAFISSFLNDENDAVSLAPEHAKLPFGGPGDAESRPVRQLRNHSKYLSEGGFRTNLTIAALVAYGLVVSWLLLAPLILVGVLVSAIFFKDAFLHPKPFWPLSAPTQWLLWALAGSVLILPIVQRTVLASKLSRLWQGLCVALLAASLAFIAIEALPLLSSTDVRGAPALILELIFAAIACGVLGLRLGTGSATGRGLLGAFGLLGPLMVFAVFVWLLEAVIGGRWSISNIELGTFAVVSLLYATFVLDINIASPHRFYRNRLARTYLVRAVNGSESLARVDPQALSAMNRFSKAPYQLINCAVNIPNCKDPNLRGRNTDFFLLSKYFCGSPITGYRTTGAWEASDGHLDLGSATAISGAAAAPHMGTVTDSRYTFLLAMLNIRLGYWLKTPAKDASRKGWSSSVPVGWFYFFLELTGLMSEKTRFLNLSDGGHIENLGIYELLRRGCKFIIAIDGEADPQRSFGGLLTLTQLAKIDLGVRIEPDLSDLRIDRDGNGRAHFGLSRIDYQGGGHGLLLYIKSSLTGNESEFLKRYRVQFPDFPHQSTAQQLFSETQFEAYRELGEHVARDLFRPDLVGEWKNEMPIHEWYERLATQLLD